jgi:hypothetical protein
MESYKWITIVVTGLILVATCLILGILATTGYFVQEEVAEEV